MRDLSILFAGPFFDHLGRALVAFVWQGAVVAALLAGLQAALPRDRARLRYAAACAALGLMVLLPIFTIVGSLAGSRRDVSLPFRAAPTAGLDPSEGRTRSALPFDIERVTRELPSLQRWLIAAWLAGVGLLSLRYLAAWGAAERLRRRDIHPARAELEVLLARLSSRLGVRTPVRLFESAAVTVPMAIGALKPVILLPLSVLSGLSPAQVEAVLAHELAHIRRRDYLVNVLQSIAETFLFYHPGVWWVSGRIRIERENCCDDEAVAATGDRKAYARALVELEERRVLAPRPVLAANGGVLWGRIVRLFPRPVSSKDRIARPLGAAVALTALFTVGAAARVAFDPVIEDLTGSQPLSATAAEAEVVVVEARAARAAGDNPAGEKRAPGEEKKSRPAADRGRLTPEELVAFKIHGVTPEFIDEMAALGGPMKPDDLVALRIHSVDREYVSRMKALFPELTLEEALAFKIHGVTPEKVRELSALGLGSLTPEDALALQVHAVDAASVRAFREAGHTGISAEDAVSLNIHGVSPADAAAWQALGFSRPSLDDLVALRIHGVGPDFVRTMRSLGFEKEDLETMTSFRIHGVSPEFIETFRKVGYAGLRADDAVAFRVHGITPELVGRLAELGYREVSPDDLVSLRVHGIDPDAIRRMNAKARERLSLDQLLESRIHGLDEEE